MPFVATQIQPEILIVSEVKDREIQTSYDIMYMWNFKKNETNEQIYKTERDSQTQRTKGNDGEKGWTGGLGLACAH